MTRMTKKASVRIGGILAGTGVLFVGGALIMSAPALADNGPHISTVGSNSIGAGPDGCAGCHRIHAAKSDNGMLLVNTSETALCRTCHEGGAGATTDVMNGVQYNQTTADPPVFGTVSTRALRGGGFTNALIGSGGAMRSTSGTSIDNTQSVVPIGTSVGTTSKHVLGSGTLWGSGAISATANAGSTVTLECGSCHDPHGNGNFRILKPVGGVGAQTIKAGVALAGASAAADTVNSGKFVWTLNFATNPGFVSGQPVAIVGSNYAFAPSLACTTSRCSWTQANISATAGSGSAWTVAIPNMTGNPGAFTGPGTVSTALPNTIKSATALVADAGATPATYTMTYTTYINHGLSNGQKVTVSGSSTGFNAFQAVITVTGANTFTLVAPQATAPTTYDNKAYISGIPDSLAVTTSDTDLATAGYAKVGVRNKVYNTTNFWRADDHFYTGSYTATGVQVPPSATDTTSTPTNGESAFIINASQWCTTCHTRYLTANSTSRKFTSGDAIFTFRHTGGAYKENSPDCIQCHVAHGSNAQMDGIAGDVPPPSAAYTTPPTGGTNSSRLLRVDNRGTCLFCHQ
jgi:predicted CXXCH cytochrome family protein